MLVSNAGYFTKPSKEAFPTILPIDDRGNITTEWPSQGAESRWAKANLYRFLFPLSVIVEGQVKYEYRGGDRYPLGSGIYFLMMDDLIGYVGRATDIGRRLEAHYKNPSKPFTHYWCIQGVPAAGLDRVENMYLEWLRPPMNFKYLGCCDVAKELIAGWEPQIPLEGD